MLCSLRQARTTDFHTRRWIGVGAGCWQCKPTGSPDRQHWQTAFSHRLLICQLLRIRANNFSFSIMKLSTPWYSFPQRKRAKKSALPGLCGLSVGVQCFTNISPFTGKWKYKICVSHYHPTQVKLGASTPVLTTTPHVLFLRGMGCYKTK